MEKICACQKLLLIPVALKLAREVMMLESLMLMLSSGSEKRWE